MKKLFAVILSLIMTFSLFSCDSSDSSDSSDKKDEKKGGSSSSSSSSSSSEDGGKEYSGVTFSVVSATKGVSSNEQAERLFDFDANTKWCVVNFSGAEVIFELSEPVKISGYSILTGEDNETWNGRNPVSWELSGSTDGSEWVVIDSKTDCDALPEKNNVKCDFDVDTEEEYSYYRLYISKVCSGACMQISEFSLDYNGADIKYKNMPGSGSGLGSDSGSGAGSDSDSGSGSVSGSGSSVPEGTYAGSQTVINGYEYTFEVGESVVFYNSHVIYGLYGAYNWTIIDGEDVVSLSTTGSNTDNSCTITGLKEGTATVSAYFINTDYYGLGSDYYNTEYTEEFTIKITRATSDGSFSAGGSYDGGFSGGSYGGGHHDDPHHGGTSSSCSRCGGSGRIECDTCNGTGKWTSSGSTPGYTSGAGGSYSESKPCQFCNNGERDCPNC